MNENFFRIKCGHFRTNPTVGNQQENYFIKAFGDGLKLHFNFFLFFAKTALMLTRN